jgi:hypothetical protein
MNTNKNLETLIKVRHLAEGLKSNWEQLLSAQEQTSIMLDEAQSIINLYATEKGREQFKNDFAVLTELKESVTKKFESFKNLIDTRSNENSSALYADFIKDTDLINEVFSKIGKYDESCFNEMSSSDWANMWLIIQSNLYSVKGLGEGAYIKLQMYEAFNQEEIDDLSKEIVKYIPHSFSLQDALKYKQEYVEALRQMEEEANKKDNLWDRFLNFLAGNVPFKQTPQERVMMMRWVNGEKGEL